VVVAMVAGTNGGLVAAAASVEVALEVMVLAM
jgi:hypothetical protein